MLTLLSLTDFPPPALGAALEVFEQQFVYPLGGDAAFRISHGRNYLPFFQAMGGGRAMVHAVERGGHVLGTLAQVERRLEKNPGTGAAASLMAHCLCDLKVAPSARGGTVLARLILAARRQILPHPSHACYAIVMGGTGKSPPDYTGRLDVPQFRKLGDITVIRVEPAGNSSRSTLSPASAAAAAAGVIATPEAFHCARTRLQPAGISTAGGLPERRSRMPPAPLVLRHPGDGHAGACGLLEDTRLGKRLTDAATGTEMRNAHLSTFRYSSPEAGASLLRKALSLAFRQGFQGLFASVPAAEFPALQERCAVQGRLKLHPAPAAVFGHQLPAGLSWWVDTAEI